MYDQTDSEFNNLHCETSEDMYERSIIETHNFNQTIRIITAPIILAMNHKRFTFRLVSIVIAMLIGERYMRKILPINGFLLLDKILWIPCFYLILVGFKNPIQILKDKRNKMR